MCVGGGIDHAADTHARESVVVHPGDRIGLLARSVAQEGRSGAGAVVLVQPRAGSAHRLLRSVAGA